MSVYECVALYVRETEGGPEVSVWRDYHPQGKRSRHSIAVYRLGTKDVPWAPSDILRAVADQMESGRPTYTV